MDFKKTGLVIGHEFSVRVKKKSFIISTLLTPILFAGLLIVPSLIMMNDSGDKEQDVLVVDRSGVVAQTLTDTKTIKYTVSESLDADSLRSHFNELGVDILVIVSDLDLDRNVSVNAYSSKQLNMDAKNTIERNVDDAIEDYKLSFYDIQDLKTILDDVKSDVKVTNYTVGEDGSEKMSVVELSMGISYVMAFMIYIFVLLFGNMVMTSVIQEKTNRIVEVIVSSVKPFELMIGKIVGVASVAVTQFLIWVVLTLFIVSGFTLASGMNKGADAAQQLQEQVSSVTGVDQSIVEGIASDGKVGDMLAGISDIDFPYIICCFLIYFVLGYLLYASMFAAVGSAVDNEADTNQLTLPITIPMILGLFIMLHTFQHPDSALSFWASMIPYTSPMVMLARIPFEGGVPLWQLLLSISLLAVTFIITVKIAGKIYRTGILMYGKKASLKDIARWIKF